MRAGVTPIADIAQRLPEQGRLRLGVKKGKGMAALSTWRFTSPDRAALDTLAVLHGGVVRPWTPTNHKGAPAGPAQFELISEAAEIPVVLPPDPLSGTPIYELYGGGGRLRTCDGVTAEVVEASGEDVAAVERPCICAARKVLECNLKVRLLVILPGVRFGGVWRLESKSWNAAHELPGMVSAIRACQDRGFVAGRLRVDKAEDMVGGRKRHYIVPRLGLAETYDALVAGPDADPALSSPSPTLAIEAAGPDAEELCDRAAVAVMFSYDVVAPALCLMVSKGTREQPRDLTEAECSALAGVVGRLESGMSEWEGVGPDGRACLRRLA